MRSKSSQLCVSFEIHIWSIVSHLPNLDLHVVGVHNVTMSLDLYSYNWALESRSGPLQHTSIDPSLISEPPRKTAIIRAVRDFISRYLLLIGIQRQIESWICSIDGWGDQRPIRDLVDTHPVRRGAKVQQAGLDFPISMWADSQSLWCEAGENSGPPQLY